MQTIDFYIFFMFEKKMRRKKEKKTVLEKRGFISFSLLFPDKQNTHNDEVKINRTTEFEVCLERKKEEDTGRQIWR